MRCGARTNDRSFILPILANAASMSFSAGAEQPPAAFTYFVCMNSEPSASSITARTLEYISTRTRVEILRSPRPAASPKVNAATTGAGFFSTISVSLRTLVRRRRNRHGDRYDGRVLCPVRRIENKLFAAGDLWFSSNTSLRMLCHISASSSACACGTCQPAAAGESQLPLAQPFIAITSGPPNCYSSALNDNLNIVRNADRNKSTAGPRRAQLCVTPTPVPQRPPSRCAYGIRRKASNAGFAGAADCLTDRAAALDNGAYVVRHRAKIALHRLNSRCQPQRGGPCPGTTCAGAGWPGSSRTFIHPTMEPSRAGTCSEKTRSPTNATPVF